MTDSTTGGYLAPAATPAPLQGQELQRFFQAWLVGLSGLDGTLVRPRWQAEPANLPDDTEVWAAFGVTPTKSDAFPYVGHVSADEVEDQYDQLQRHEELTILASFYGLGSESGADEVAARVRDGAVIAQNREPLLRAGMGLVSASDLLAVPSLLKERWLYRVDLSLVVRRIVVRSYPVRDIAVGKVRLQAETPGGDLVVDETIEVTPPPP